MGNVYQVWGTFQFGAGEVYAAGGNTVNLTQIGVKATRSPFTFIANPTTGYIYVYMPGTTAANGKIKILTGAAAQSALTELANGAVPAAVSNDVVPFKAEFIGMM